jgi:hypothetical protein
MVADSENAGAVQRVVAQGRVLTEEKKICRLKYDTHKIKWTNRVKSKN